MVRKKNTFLLIGIITLGIFFWGNITYAESSPQWQVRNRHLIPGKEETAAIFNLDQDGDRIKNGDDQDIDGDGIENGQDADIDGDGIKNDFDPSPLDWREIGYHPFGVLAFLSWNHKWNNFKYNKGKLIKAVELLGDMGCSFVRMDFSWNDIEPHHRVFDFDKYDFIVELLSKNNIRILGILDYCADWAGRHWNGPPYKNDYFVNYCKHVVSRYRNKIKYWEIWNEPDSPTYWQPQDGMKCYAQLLKEAYIGIKQVAPSCKVLLGGLTSEGYYSLKKLYEQGAKDYFDIINIHPFVDPLQTDAIYRIRCLYRNVKKLLAQYGDENKKIWFTELGCPGVKKATKHNRWWVGLSPDEYQQASFVEEVYQEIISWEDVEKIFWAYFRDNKKHFRSGVDYFGLIRWNFSKKPAYYEYKKAAQRQRGHSLQPVHNQ